MNYKFKTKPYEHQLKALDKSVDKKEFSKTVPGHADFAGALKFKQHDLRNVLERASARETTSRVAAGSLCKSLLKKLDISIKSRVLSIGEVTSDDIDQNLENIDWDQTEISEVRSSSKNMDEKFKNAILLSKRNKTTIGGIFQVVAFNSPVGLGSFSQWDRKLDGKIAQAMMSINAVKGVNIGSGMDSAMLTGEENSDEILQRKGKTSFKSNNAGGILGGISTGQEIKISFAVKPTSSILSSRKTIDKFGKNTTISVKGRHDPCVGIRAVPIGEAMMHCVILDHYLMNTAQNKI